jgi:hypothetical protein
VKGASRSLARIAFAAFVATTGLAGATRHAHAASRSATEASEVVRLRGELSSKVAKNQHSGAVSTFEKMLDLAKQKRELAPNDYKLAAYAARNLGDIGKAIDWFTSGGDAASASELKSVSSSLAGGTVHTRLDNARAGAQWRRR